MQEHDFMRMKTPCRRNYKIDKKDQIGMSTVFIEQLFIFRNMVWACD